MLFIETSLFTRKIQEQLPDDAYSLLQLLLLDRPDAGPVIPGSGGLRKVRWALQGRGKRGGVRVIYYWAKKSERILMLLIYAKNERDDLSPAQVKVLRQVVEKEYP